MNVAKGNIKPFNIDFLIAEIFGDGIGNILTGGFGDGQNGVSGNGGRRWEKVPANDLQQATENTMRRLMTAQIQAPEQQEMPEAEAKSSRGTNVPSAAGRNWTTRPWNFASVPDATAIMSTVTTTCFLTNT